MENKRKLSSVALVSAATILFLTVVLSIAPTTAEQSAQLKIIETRITSSDCAFDPDIYGNRIVWHDCRNENDDIYMYNLSTSKETQITTNKSHQTYPVIYGDRVVWIDSRNGNDDIYMYNLSTSKETRITSSVSEKSYPDIYSNRVVWMDQRNGNIDIYMCDLSTKKEVRITTNSSDSYHPAIYGNRIVWQEVRNDIDDWNGDIYMYDLSTKKQTRITTSGVAYYPKIYGNRIVWDNDQNISVYDLSTHNKTEINVYGEMGSTAIYGNKIVWAEGCLPENPGDCQLYDLYMYDLSTSKTTQLTADSQGPKSDVAMYGNRIVWQDGRNTDWSSDKSDIYMVTLVYSPVAAFSASPTSGKAPLTVAFTDKSTGSPTKWKWTFGDGMNSTQQNPKHQYLQAGNYKVTLTVTNAAGSNTTTKANYIKVTTNTRPEIYAESK